MTGQATDDPYGTPVEALAERLGDDAEDARRALDRIAEDGAVTEAAVTDAVTDAAGAVSTVENRTDRAALLLDELRDAADPVADVGAVAGRLDRFEDRLADLQADLAALQSDLVSVRDRTAGRGPLALARAIRDVKTRANRAHRSADELGADVESAEAWLDDPAVRYDEFDADVDALDAFVGDAAEDAAALADGAATDPADLWADAVLRHRVVGLLLADLRAELDDLQALPGGSAPDRAAAAADRLDALADRREDLGDRLDDAADPAWRDRHGDRLRAAAAAFDARDPPVDWGAVHAALDEHRPDP